MKSKIILITCILIGCMTGCNSQQQSTASTRGTDTAYTYRAASADGIGKFYHGREIAHVMGAAGSDWLERSERNREENTNLTIANIKLSPDASIADVGAGTGYYSFKLSALVPRGKVYAVEIQEELIRYLQDRKMKLKDSVVEVVRGTAASPNLPANSIDLAIMVDVYHELEYPQEMLQAIKKALRPEGKILLIEYRGEDPGVPIKALHKTSVSQLEKELGANGFRLSSRGDFLPIQHFLLFEKNN
jgi:precorrin-6B methylase 2